MSSTAEHVPGAPLFPPGLFRNILARGWIWLLAAALIGAAVGAVQAIRQPKLYRGEAVVVATSTTISSSDFANLAKTAFTTNTVLDPVIKQLGLHVKAQSLLGRGILQVQAIPGTVALRVIGETTDPNLAADLADAGARSFVAAAQHTGLGTFTVFGTSSSGVAVARPVKLNIVRGAALGLLIMILVLAVLGLRHRPVLSLQDARRELHPEHAFTARIDRPLLPSKRRSDGRVHPRGTLRAVWRAVEADAAPADSPPCCVVLLGRGGALNTVLREMTQQYLLDQAGNGDRQSFVWAWAGDRSLPVKLEGSRVVVTVVAKGVATKGLRDLEQEIEVAPGIDSRILLFVS